MKINREASLKEVLAEVNFLDLWAAAKAIFSQMGCLLIFFAILAFIGQVTGYSRDTGYGFGIPDWAFWLFTIWIFVGLYTSDTSYHEHRFAWYFPKLGFVWSTPLAFYFLVGIEIYRGGLPDMDAWEKAGHFLLAAIWWFPFFLGVSLLEIGHNRLMGKRANGSTD